ncbi:VCBS domain-containing protein [Flavisphingomonas formosensis]|uniref:VCBS domain-containing protein n=1 Tax=Flavisphingomonas formosensis TaxID=861534 RepID=UPI0018DF19FF|nr:VCBS domain-containing protein [Sphingomonas formosensis]
MVDKTGGTGADVLAGTSGDDTLYGGDGNDTLRGGDGGDTLYGGEGADTLDGGNGDDVMVGGNGNDTYIVMSAGDVVIESDNQGVDLVKAYVSYSLSANLENIYLMGTDAIDGTGNGLANGIRGNDANNILSGLGGNDQIDAGGGNDRLLGGAGSDYLKGGAGADAFVFAASDLTYGGSATDQIADLSFASGDTIVLTGFREGAPRVIDSYASLVHMTDVDPTVTVAKKAEGGQINVSVQGPGGTTQTITITDADGSAWNNFSAAAVRPVAGADVATTDEKTLVSINVLANDTGPDLSVIAAHATSGLGKTTIVDNHVVFAPGADFNYLAAGESANVTIEYTLSTAAGRTTTGTVTLTVTGLDNPAEIAGVTTGDVYEGGEGQAAGHLTITDADHDQAAFQAQTVTGTFGELTITASGDWQYTLDDHAPGLKALNTGESSPEHILVHSLDGTTQSIEITVHGHDEVITLPTAYAGGGDPNDMDGVTGGGVLYSTVSDAALRGSNILYGTADADTIDSKNGNDTVYGWGGDDVISGGQGIDTIYGGSGNDALDGNQAQDTLYGGSGDDIIRGLQGNDRIVGGYGADMLVGHDGTDTFAFLDVKDTNDTIVDFLPGTDKLDFSSFFDGGVQHHFTGPVKATHFSAGHDLIWSTDGNTTVILGDTDGNYSTAEFMVTIQGQPPLTAADFTL